MLAAAVAFATVGIAVSAQAPSQGQRGAGAPAPQQTAGADERVTVTGCIQREADYRKARDAGRGGVAGTGVGAGNEFVLVNASMAPAGAGRAGSGAAGTSGTAAEYEITGTNEGQASQFVGKRVEIAGMLKAAETRAGQPTGGPTSGKPPEGVDVAGRDLKLRELEITTIKESSGACPAL
jgi:hypothetical protein